MPNNYSYITKSNNTNLYEYTKSFILDFKYYIISVIIIAVIAAILEISVDYKIKEIIDNIASSKGQNLQNLILLFILYKLMHHGSYFIFMVLGIVYKPQIVQHSVTEIYAKTMRHSLHWFDSKLSGEISNKISDFQNSVDHLIENSFRVFNIITLIIITLFFLYSINILTVLVLLGFIIIYTPIIYFLLKKQMNLEENYVETKQQAIGIINDSVTNVFATKVIGSLFTEFKFNLKPAIERWKLWEKKVGKFNTYVIDNSDTLMVVIMSGLQIYLIATLYQSGAISSGEFTFIAMITLKIHGQIDTLLENLLYNIAPDIARIRSSYKFVNSPISVEDCSNAIVLDSFTKNIKYNNVNFSYGKENNLVLKDFNLEIKVGQRIGIVGISGAGKTTMVKCLLRYFDVSSGSITIDNMDIRNIAQESLWQFISIIPQDINMFHRSIKENLQLAKHDASDKEIMDACKKAKIHDEIMAMPKKYNSIVGERGIKLSGGQRQRIAIARAILKNAPILILDEATSNLDSSTEKLIQESINELLESGKMTVIVIAHRLSTLKHMDRIIVLDNGTICEEGTHSSLIRKKNGLYKNLWEMQTNIQLI